jgi:hypothetical protein
MVFRLSDAALLATVPLPASLESPISLASMGANGVAITTTAGKPSSCRDLNSRHKLVEGRAARRGSSTH